MENVIVPRSLVERIEAILKCHAEYGMDHIFEETGDKTPNAILCEEIASQLKTLTAAPTVEQEPVKSMASMDYAVALQRAIEYHCRGEIVPEFVANDCPHHARRLNDALNSPPADKQAAQEGETPRFTPRSEEFREWLLDRRPDLNLACGRAIEMLDELEHEFSTTASDIFEKCARICKNRADASRRVLGMADYAIGAESCEESIRAEALKVSAGGR